MKKVLSLAALSLFLALSAYPQTVQHKPSIWQKVRGKFARHPILSNAVLPHSVTLTLTWLPAGDAPLGFNVYRSQTTGGPYTLVGKLGPTWYTYVDKNIVPGSAYYYMARAYNAAGETADSNEITAIIPVVIPGNAPVLSGVVQ